MMSGTSADGVDAALVKWPDGAAARPFELLAFRESAFPVELQQRIHALAAGRCRPGEALRELGVKSEGDEEGEQGGRAGVREERVEEGLVEKHAACTQELGGHCTGTSRERGAWNNGLERQSVVSVVVTDWNGVEHVVERWELGERGTPHVDADALAVAGRSDIET